MKAQTFYVYYYMNFIVRIHSFKIFRFILNLLFNITFDNIVANKKKTDYFNL